jgi:uncharacterized protein (TIGR00369 family)
MNDASPYEPVDADVEERIRKSYERQALMRHLGARLELVAQGRVHVVLPGGEHLTGHHGHIHPGATSAVADTAGEFAALTLVGPRDDVVGFEYKINFTAPAEGDHLEAIGTVIRAGRTLSVSRLEVFGVDGSRRRLVATGQQTLLRVAVP